MTPAIWLSAAGATISAIALLMTIRNLARYRTPPERSMRPSADGLVSICIPARNEQDNIEACVRAALASDTAVEVLVYDDESTDNTPEILARLAEEDPRVRRVETRPMPDGWSGKQHACDRMGRSGDGDWVLFTDADVRLEPQAARRAVAFALERECDLVSTFPRQICGTLGELLQVPMMFFILFSYLPFGRMQRTNSPAASAGCGQFLLARRISYLRTGGHAAFRASMHDGVKMPRAFRRLGLRTDLFDGTDLVSVRMYQGFAESWRGFSKNAFEGLGSVFLLCFLTVTHAIGHILPWVLLVVGILTGEVLLAAIAGAACAIQMLQRVILCRRFRHPIWLACLHPLTILLMTLVQWDSLRLERSRSRSWRGRSLRQIEGERVVLVDEQDQELGDAEKIEAHLEGGRLHRAFSVFIFDRQGRLMMQRRAAGKYHFGGLWTNTACGHPRPGESPGEAGRRRLAEEMGIDTPLKSAGWFIYEASDPASGLTERELDHVLYAVCEQEPIVNPAEASDWQWIEPSELDRRLARAPEEFTPWFPLAWEKASPMLRTVSVRSTPGAEIQTDRLQHGP